MALGRVGMPSTSLIQATLRYVKEMGWGWDVVNEKAPPSYEGRADVLQSADECLTAPSAAILR